MAAPCETSQLLGVAPTDDRSRLFCTWGAAPALEAPPPRPGLLDVRRARDASFVLRLVKRLRSDEGEWMDGSRRAKWVLTRPSLFTGIAELREYGVPLAGTLLLRLTLECAAALMLMLLLSVPTMANNFARNSERNWCASRQMRARPAKASTSAGWLGARRAQTRRGAGAATTSLQITRRLCTRTPPT